MRQFAPLKCPINFLEVLFLVLCDFGEHSQLQALLLHRELELPHSEAITSTRSHDVRESCQDGGIWLWLSGLISIMQLWIALLATFCKVFHFVPVSHWFPEG
jgi:hypothetical protein